MKIPNSKNQIPNNTEIPVSKHRKNLHSDVWDLGIGIYLEFDAWNLEFTSRGGGRG